MILGVPGSICCGSGVACVRLVVDRGSTRGVDPDSLRGVSIRGRSGGRLGVNSGPSGIGSGPIWGRAGADLASISGRLGVVPGLGGGHCTPGVVCRAPPPPAAVLAPPQAPACRARQRRAERGSRHGGPVRPRGRHPRVRRQRRRQRPAAPTAVDGAAAPRPARRRRVPGAQLRERGRGPGPAPRAAQGGSGGGSAPTRVRHWTPSLAEVG